MPSFGKKSKERLSTCIPEIQELVKEVVKHFDCSVLCGHRNEEEQMLAYNAVPQRSGKKWPESKHNAEISTAIDVVPYPSDWEDRERFHYFAGFVKGIAKSMGLEIRWGGDWDSDTEVRDNDFDDLPHFERR